MFGRFLCGLKLQVMNRSLSSMTRWPRRTLISCICLRRTRIWWYRRSGGGKGVWILAWRGGKWRQWLRGLCRSSFWSICSEEELESRQWAQQSWRDLDPGAGEHRQGERQSSRPTPLSYSGQSFLFSESFGAQWQQKLEVLWSKFQSEEIWISSAWKSSTGRPYLLKGLWIIASSSSFVGILLYSNACCTTALV